MSDNGFNVYCARAVPVQLTPTFRYPGKVEAGSVCLKTVASRASWTRFNSIVFARLARFIPSNLISFNALKRFSLQLQVLWA